MREFWVFIGGVAVGILAVTGVFALEEDGKPRSIEHGEEEMEEAKEETDGEGRLIARIS